jgi:hypothetical protein
MIWGVYSYDEHPLTDVRLPKRGLCEAGRFPE